MNPRIYLDFNASTPIDPSVLQVILEALQTECGNPSSIHLHGRQARQKLEECRESIAHFLQVKPQEIFFTSGGTEGAHTLMHGILLQKPFGHLITSSAEHACVYQTAKELEKKGYAVTFLSPGEWGAVKPEAILEAIQPDTRLIALMAVNNETGVKTDWEAIAAVAEKFNIPFVLDGVSLLGKETFKLPKGVAAAFFSGHKIYTPKGVGFCCCRQSMKLLPTFAGGSQEFNRRAGTENFSGIIGLAKAIHIIAQDQTSITGHLEKMRGLLESTLLSQLTDVQVNGRGPRIVNTANLTFHGVDGEALLMKLDLAGVSVSHGSACSSGALEPSRILLNMGLPLSAARSAIRFSVGRTTSAAEIERASAIIINAVNELRKS
ncbi:MAG: cysteine desulfurase family protein [Chlamydiales bacterium]